ncbi:MAG: helix-turn-helix domain-containing protein [Prevotellaceae bacterium]|jgi:transcriptional regulator with XRE-family HTH domain|nr:helix-turn-helix domain-containing protein [Prevotellaceae bacterium]
MKTTRVHIGEKIKEKVKERGLNIANFASKIHCGRTTVYSIFQSESIDMQQLCKISNVLDYDFIWEYYLDEDKKSQRTHVVVAEMSETKLSELSSDKSITLIKTWMKSKKMTD